MTRLKDLKKRLMEDPEFQEEYAQIDDEFRLIEARLLARELGAAAARVCHGGRIVGRRRITPGRSSRRLPIEVP